MIRLKAVAAPTFLAVAALSAAVSAAAPASAALAAPAPAGSMRQYKALALSADGQRIVALESVDGDSAANAGGKPHASVVMRDAASGKVLFRYDPCASCNYDRPSWSPDGSRVAFIGADAKTGTATVYVAAAAKAQPLVSLKGVANTARWSPDGSQLALLATVGARKLTGAVEAGARMVGEIGTRDDEQRIALVSAAVAAGGGKLRLVSPADTFIYEYDWTPDGKGFVATSARGNGDNNWWVAKLSHVDAASGALRIVASPKTQLNFPRVSADGQTVAFIGGLMSDFGSIGGDVYTVPLAGGEPVNVTPGFAGTFNGLAWRGKDLLTTAQVGANQSAIALDPDTRSTKTLWSAPVSSSGADGRLAFSAGGAFAAAVQEDFTHAPAIVAGRMPQLAAITHENDALAAQVSASSVSWTSDGFNAQGWLLGPQGVTAGEQDQDGKKHPMVVIVHGGPGAAHTPHYVGPGEDGNALARELTAKGYFVFLPNPRGSFGQGQAFTQANVRDFGGGDWRDILAGVDQVLKVAPVDGERLGLFGHSYGGYMTMWGVTHSRRFKAAVAGAGIANWISYYGQNGIDQWMLPFFGASAYDDPAIYRAASPIESIKAAKTPTLVYVGERDVECPAVQSMEFWHGLQAMGTETSLVIYDGEGHALRKPENRLDLRRRTLAWFDKHLGAAG